MATYAELVDRNSRRASQLSFLAKEILNSSGLNLDAYEERCNDLYSAFEDYINNPDLECLDKVMLTQHVQTQLLMLSIDAQNHDEEEHIESLIQTCERIFTKFPVYTPLLEDIGRTADIAADRVWDGLTRLPNCTEV